MTSPTSALGTPPSALQEDVVLSVRGVSKCFEMYEKPVHRLYQTLCAGHKKFYREFWALKDISFDVHRGECVGIIGRNGAGKSTLLQIITGTLAPTTGSASLKGRVAALLELGSGFNPEFTGRENVYLNGSILGLSREEIDKRYDDILAFADIGEFINQPVKTYSSGMVVRLAFAVNAFVDPDVLIVDEALAVGDVAFQSKCFRKMREILGDKSKSVIFVTHDMVTVKTFCQRIIWIEQGLVKDEGAPLNIVENYLAFMGEAAAAQNVKAARESQKMDRSEAPMTLLPIPKDVISNGIGGARITHVGLFDLHDRLVTTVQGPAQLRLSFRFETEVLIAAPLLAFHITDRKGTDLLGSNNLVKDVALEPIPAGSVRIVDFTFSLPELHNDDYLFLLAVNDYEDRLVKRLHNIVNAYKFTVASTSLYQLQGVVVKMPDCKLKVSR